VTVASDATAEEFMDFYLDDPTRPKWVRAAHKAAAGARRLSRGSARAAARLSQRRPVGLHLGPGQVSGRARQCLGQLRVAFAVLAHANWAAAAGRTP
jgi:hypothetical protein